MSEQKQQEGPAMHSEPVTNRSAIPASRASAKDARTRASGRPPSVRVPSESMAIAKGNMHAAEFWIKRRHLAGPHTLRGGRAQAAIAIPASNPRSAARLSFTMTGNTRERTCKAVAR